MRTAEQDIPPVARLSVGPDNEQLFQQTGGSRIQIHGKFTGCYIHHAAFDPPVCWDQRCTMVLPYGSNFQSQASGSFPQYNLEHYR